MTSFLCYDIASVGVAFGMGEGRWVYICVSLHAYAKMTQVLYSINIFDC